MNKAKIKKAQQELKGDSLLRIEGLNKSFEQGGQSFLFLAILA